MRRATTVAAALLAALALGACGTSPEDEARNEGEQIGADLRDLGTVTSADEARTVLAFALLLGLRIQEPGVPRCGIPVRRWRSP